MEHTRLRRATREPRAAQNVPSSGFHSVIQCPGFLAAEDGAESRPAVVVMRLPPDRQRGADGESPDADDNSRRTL